MFKINKCRVFIFVLFFVSFLIIVNIILYSIKKGNSPFSIKDIFYREAFSIEKFNKQMKYRNPSGLNYKNRNIVLFGCAYTKGDDLSDNQTFSAKLSELTKRPVYNRGIGGGGIQHALVQVQGGELDDIIKNSDFVIYTVSSFLDFDRLLYFPGAEFDYSIVLSTQMYPRYKKNKQNVLQIYESKNPIIEGSVLYQILYKIFSQIKYEKFNPKEKNYELAVEHFLLLNEEIKKINKNTQLVIMFYWNKKEIFGFDNIKTLNDNGIKIIELSDKTREIVRMNKVHKYSNPSEKDWDIIVPEVKSSLGI